MRETMPTRQSQHERRSLRSWRLGALLLAGVPVCIALAACAESGGIAIDPDTTIPGQEGTVTMLSEARCGAGGIECGGSGCCPAGNVCAQDNTCVPSTPCTSNAECSSDTTCGGSACRAWATFPAAVAFDLTCRDGIDLPSLRPEVQCSWPGPTPPSEFPNSVQVIGTPMVVDFNFDDDPATLRPSIVFISYEGSLADGKGVLRVIDGATCGIQASIFGGEEHPFVPDVSPALGDVDNDGRPDIVVVDTERNGTSTKTGVAVYRLVGRSQTFELISRQTSSLTSRIKGVSIHDVADDNDVPEILTDTGMYFYKDELAGIQERVNVEGSASEPPIVHDVNGDAIPEMVTARGIFNWNTETLTMSPTQARNQPLWNPEQDVNSAAFVGLADLGNFPGTAIGRDSAEMVVVSNGQLLVTQVDGRVQLRVQSPGIAGGPPVIADFDADGRMEFASPGLDMITAFDLDCVDDEALNPNPANCKNPDGPNPQGILWTKRNARGATSGASVFDFDGDRKAEVVYADQCFMRILDGSTGNVLFSVPRSSTTRWDYPVIVDVDGDGHTDIVTSSNDNDLTLNCPLQDDWDTGEVVRFQATHGITVWADAEKRWAGSRPIWNQHAYSITNVNDDGTIPKMGSVASQFQRAAEDPNSLRQNVQGATGISLELPDLTTSGNPVVQCQQGQMAKLSLQLCNRGLLALGPGRARVALAQADRTTNVLCDRTNATALGSGKCEPITCDVVVPATAPGLNIAVLADPGSAVRECTEGRNNTSIVSNVFCAPGIR
jgi:hypothetical protein